MGSTKKRERLFIKKYLAGYSANEAAISAGYSELEALGAENWVSITACPRDMLALRNATFKALEAQNKSEVVNSEWVLRRAALLADFNIKKFIRLNSDGEAVYDFTRATIDEYYCIEEYTYGSHLADLGAGIVKVSDIRVKTSSRLAALKLVGSHINVKAFEEKSSPTAGTATFTMNFSGSAPKVI